MHKHFILVPGAYRGAWLWDRLVPQLEALGHSTAAICPIGVGERKDEGCDVDMQQQVDDVIAAIDRANGHAIVLVGHSLAGLHVSAAAAARPDKTFAVVFLDALIPKQGDSFRSIFIDHFDNPDIWKEQRTTQFVDERGGWSHPNGAVLHELDENETQTFLHRLTPHPLQVLLDPVPEVPRHIPKVFIACTRTHLSLAEEQITEAEAQGMLISYVETGHDPMWTRPIELATVLDRAVSKSTTRAGVSSG